VLPLRSVNGKINADQVREAVALQADFEHTVKPGMVYISLSTEYGTLYSLNELKALYTACQELNIPLFIDGARLGYALASPANDIPVTEIAKLCDVFYIGGTKVGALFGEALVISNEKINHDFRYMIKRHGGMMAKGWQLGIQFDALFENDLYFDICAHANQMADRIRDTLKALAVPELAQCTTNQIFPILPDAFLEELSKDFTFTEMHRVDENHRAIRFCTSWATTEESVDALCSAMRRIAKA
jgi:threonine aldolase